MLHKHGDLRHVHEGDSYHHQHGAGPVSLMLDGGLLPPMLKAVINPNPAEPVVSREDVTDLLETLEEVREGIISVMNAANLVGVIHGREDGANSHEQDMMQIVSATLDMARTSVNTATYWLDRYRRGRT